jgi:hypothetical protein
MSEARDLYGLPLDRFIAERGALTKTLRSGGDREGAAEVARLRKPSVAAWAVNQLVRTQQGAVAELFDAGDRLQRAQSELLAGRGDAQALQEAAERARATAEELTATARGLLSSEGHELSAVTLERVRETLNAGALDQAARTKVSDGCLERELRHAGLGDTGEPIATRKPARRPRKAAADARRAAERAAKELRTAQERRDRAADALANAEVALAGAQRAAEQAQQALTRVETL